MSEEPGLREQFENSPTLKKVKGYISNAAKSLTSPKSDNSGNVSQSMDNAGKKVDSFLSIKSQKRNKLDDVS